MSDASWEDEVARHVRVLQIIVGALVAGCIFFLVVVLVAGLPCPPQKRKKLYISKHKQPHAAERMVNHLRGLPIRDSVEGTGFDAYATLVVDCDNQGPVTLWSAPPAPQPGERDHYDTFVKRIAEAYARLGL